jgi:hypothetical protein
MSTEEKLDAAASQGFCFEEQPLPTAQFALEF